jgi:hypothetical protein
MAGVTLLASYGVLSVQAVHNEGFFELGPTAGTPEAGITNILGNTTAAGPDWADLFTATGPSGTDVTQVIANGIKVCETSPGKECAFIADPSSAAGASDPSTFSGFGTSNKNVDPISTADCANRTPPLTGSGCTPWGWDAGNIPAKDDLTNVYSYEVVPTTGPRTGHVLVYGGIEREAPNGDSHVDLEFFLSPVALCATPTCFTGVRTVGDIVISMDFLKGGALGSVTVRKWDGTTYILQGAAGGEGCFTASGAPGDDICAFNNSAPIDGGPWANYDSHGKVITSLPANAFTEMGVDLTNVLGESPCIATFMGKTRSSGSFTSELKDFAGPTAFSRCAPSTLLTKTVDHATIHSGDLVTYTYTETNDGKDPLSNVSVTDDSCTPLSAPVKTGGNQDAILDPGETWTYTCSTSLITTTTTNTATATGTDTLTGKTVTWCDPTQPDPANTFCDQDEQAQATVTVINPATTLTKTAAVSVTYTFNEANTGNDPISGVSVTDSTTGSGLTGCTVTAVLGTDGTHNIGDLNNNGTLDPAVGTTAAETFTFHCTVTSTDGTDVDVTDAGTGHGTDSLLTAVPTTNESDGVNVKVTHCSGVCP